MIEGLEKMDIVQQSKVRFHKVYRTKHAYVVRTFDYLEKLKQALGYLNDLGILSVGRNSEFEYINMDEAVRRGLEAVHKIETDTSAEAP